MEIIIFAFSFFPLPFSPPKIVDADQGERKERSPGLKRTFFQTPQAENRKLSIAYSDATSTYTPTADLIPV